MKPLKRSEESIIEEQDIGGEKETDFKKQDVELEEATPDKYAAESEPPIKEGDVDEEPKDDETEEEKQGDFLAQIQSPFAKKWI